MPTNAQDTQPREFRSIDEFRETFFPKGDREDSPTGLTQVNSTWPAGASLADAVLDELSKLLPAK
jgi:hypothetical protein